MKFNFIKKLKSKYRGIYLKLYFYFKSKILFKDKYGLSYYLYKDTRPLNTFDIGVRTDDTTVLSTIDKILSSPTLQEKDFVYCIDVGAYIGVITLMMSKKLQKQNKLWSVHTFEPFDESFKKLEENVNLDRYKNNIKLNKIAVSDTQGFSTLSTYKKTPGMNHLHDDNLSNDKKVDNYQKVKTITLSEYMTKNNIDNVSICKIDT